MTVVQILAMLVSALLSLLEFAMLIRAVLSWVPGAGESMFGSFIAMVTEPILAPFRALCDRFGLFRNSPIDFSFLIAFIVLSVLQGGVSSLTRMIF